jgi:murein endopeptidase
VIGAYLAALVALTLGISGGVSAVVAEVPPPTTSPAVAAPCPNSDASNPAIIWRASRAVGRPTRGRLVDGVMLPVEGTTFATWDPGLAASPSREWRRWGTDTLIRTTLCVLADFHSAHTDSSRVLIGDISLPSGGPFGRELGGLGHSSHQNGLDVDIYYPRLDGIETAALSVNQIDRQKSQELVDRFVAAGVVNVFVGRRTGLSGPAGVVRFVPHHDDHLHVRFASQ